MENIKPYTKYRPSGITWLDYIPEHWDVKSVRKSFLFSVGFTPPTEKDEYFTFSDNGIPWITIRDMKGKYISKSKQDISQFYIETFNKPLILKGSLLYSFKLSVGKVGFANIDLFTNEAIFSVLPNENYCLNYFYYSLPNQIIKNASENIYGAKILNQSLIKSAKIVFPPIEEQKTIANFLDYKTAKIDRFIRKKKQLIKLLNEQKIGIVNHAVTKGLNDNVKTKPSGIDWLGDIPEHWKVKKLKGICKAFGRIGFRGYKLTDLVNQGEGAITISPSNMKYDFMTFDNCTYLSWEKYEESPEIKIFNDDIIMVKTGSTYGKVGIVKNLQHEATINPQLLVLKNITINPNYLYLLLKSNLIQSQVKTEVIGSTIPTISQTKILNFNLVMPPNEEIEDILISIEKETLKRDKTIATIEKEIDLVQEYRTTLIAEAVTGKFDLRDYQLPVIDEELLYEEFEEEELDMVAEDGETMEIE